MNIKLNLFHSQNMCIDNLIINHIIQCFCENKSIKFEKITILINLDNRYNLTKDFIIHLFKSHLISFYIFGFFKENKNVTFSKHDPKIIIQYFWIIRKLHEQ